MHKTKTCFYRIRVSGEIAKNTCLLLFACNLLLMISLPGQADHESSGWPFPVPEAIAINKLNSLLGGGSYSITAQQMVEIVNHHTNITSSEGVIYWGDSSSGVAEAIKTESGAPSSINASDIKKALTRSDRVWENADALAQALAWLNDPNNTGSAANSFTAEDVFQLVMQHTFSYSGVDWYSVANSLQNSPSNVSGYSFTNVAGEVENQLTYYPPVWPFPAPAAQALAGINDPDNNPATTNNDLTAEELISFAESHVTPANQSPPYLFWPSVDWQQVATDINNNSGGATGSLSAGQLLRALGVLYWPSYWAPEASALAYLNDPDDTPGDLSDDNAFTADGLLYLYYWGAWNRSSWSESFDPWSAKTELNSVSSSVISGGRGTGNTFTFLDLLHAQGLVTQAWSFSTSAAAALIAINDLNNDGTPDAAYTSADMLVAMDRNTISGTISLGGSSATVTFTDWAAVANQLGNTEDQLRNALGMEPWPFPADQATAMAFLNDPNDDGTPDFNFSPDLVVQIVKDNAYDTGLDADWNTISLIFSASSWTIVDGGGSEAPPWRLSGGAFTEAQIKTALGVDIGGGIEPVWLFPVSSAETLAFLNDPNGTPDDPADDNSFDEASLIMHVSNSTTSSPLTTDWVAVAQAISSAGTGAGYTFTQGEVMQAFGAWEYSVAPDEALNALNDPDQDTNTINGSLTIDQLLAHISAAATDSYVNWPQVTSSLESGELSSVEYQFTVAGPAVNFQYAGGMKGDYVSNALGVGLGSHEWLYYYGPYAPTPTEVAASLNDPDYDSVDENNFTPVWVMTYFEGPLLSTSEIFNNPDSTGDYENYWLFHEFEFVDPEGWQWPYSSPVETALPLLNDPDQDGNSVAKFTPGSFAKDRDNQFVYKATSDTPNGSVTNWGWVAQNLSNAGLNGYLLYGDTQGAPAVNVPATPGYTITADQIKQALGLPNTSDRAWPYPRSEAEVMSDLNNPSSAGFSGVNWSNNNFTADFILDMIEAYTSNGVTDWSGVATALNQDGVADGTTDDQPDNSFAGAAADYTQTSYLPAILTGETGYSALTAISTWSFPAAEAEALAKINQISQRVTTSGPPVQYQDFTALDIINYVGQYTGQLSNQTDWDGVAAQLNNGASISTGDPNTSTIFSGFSGSWLKSTLGFLAWGFPRSEVAALMHLNSIDSISGEATNTFTTMDVLSALDGNGFEEPHVADFDFQLAADTLNNQELDAIGQLDQNDLLTALYWDFPAAPDQALDFFNDADKDGTEENAFVIKDLLTAIGFEVNAEIIDWALAAADLNDPDNDGSDDNALTSSLVELGFGFGAMDSELALAYVNLLPGINMISPPNQPQTAYTARSLIQHIHTSKHADDDDANIVPGEFVLDENGDPTATPKTDVNWLIRYDAIDQNFDAYVWTIDNMQDDPTDTDDSDGTDQIPNPGFAIEGGQGYIVNVISARAVQFMGTVWEGVLNPLTPPATTPSLELKAPKTWAFILLGQLPSQLTSQTDKYSLRVTNMGTGRLLAETDLIKPKFRLPMVDSLRQSIVHQGDLIRVEASDLSGQRLADTEFVIGQEDLATAYRMVDLQYNPIPDLTRLLQNYPNPFNPETWIPFDLSQDAEVIITVYDVAGRRVRFLPVGFKPAGIYRSRDRAAYWDGKTETGEQVASGVYFYHVRVGQADGQDYLQTRRMVILK